MQIYEKDVKYKGEYQKTQKFRDFDCESNFDIV